MDILSIFHVVVGMAEKALSAPPNFDEMRQAIFDVVSDRQAELIKLMDITRLDSAYESQRPGSEAQRKLNSFMMLVFAFHAAMQEYYQQALILLDQAKKIEARIAALELALAELAKSQSNWEQGMLDAEQEKMQALLQMYQQQQQDLTNRLHHIAHLHAQLTELNSQIMHHANIIQQVTSERMEKIENIVNQSTNNQLNTLDNVTVNLNRLLTENTEKLQEVQQQMVQSDLTGQQHEELKSKAAEYQDKIDKYKQAIDKTEQFKQQIIENKQAHEQLKQETQENMNLAAASGDPLKILKAGEEASVRADASLYQVGNMGKESISFFEGLKNNLPAEAAEFIDKGISETQERSISLEEELVGAVEHADSLLKSSLTQLDHLTTSYSNLKTEIKEQVKEVDQLEVNVMRLKRDLTGYNNRHPDSLPPPSNDNTIQTPRH